VSNEELVPVFIPALVAILVNFEDQKGAPLTDAEVMRIRDEAAVIMAPLSVAASMVETRGYVDIDPENCWHDWQMARRNLGREPALDAGARIVLVNADDKAIKDSVLAARNSLARFRELISGFDKPWSPLVKMQLAEPGYSANMWLAVTQTTDAEFIAELFEIPRELQSFKIGDAFTVRDDDVLDWMINDAGTLHGGYSLRLHRERLPEAERGAFDHHIGVERYA